MSVLDSKIPEGPIKDKWTNHKNNINVVNPANKRLIDVIASDAHRNEESYTEFTKVLQYIEKKTDKEYVDLITKINPEKIIFGKYKRGVRSLIAVARREGYLIADEIVINSKTGRKNKSYYMEANEIKFYRWAKKSGAFNFKPGAPTY